MQVRDYHERYAQDVELPRDSRGQALSPTYLIHTVVGAMRDMLLMLFHSTTTYDREARRFHLDASADGALPPMLRFHLAQIRCVHRLATICCNKSR